MVPGQAGPARGDDVADPGQAGERQPIGAGRRPEADHLGQATGHQPGLAVVAEAEPVGGPRSDRDHVLERAAQLDAEDVAIHVQPELRATEPFADARAQRPVVGSHDRGRRQTLGDLVARFGPDSAAIRGRIDAVASAITSLIRRSDRFSSPLTTDSTSADGAHDGPASPATDRRCDDGTAKITRSVAPRDGSGRPTRPAPPAGRCPAGGAQFRCDRLISSATSGRCVTRHDRLALREDGGERRAPRPGADDRVRSARSVIGSGAA
jgi:hypothetical protein